MRLRFLVVAAVSLGLLVSACGGSSGASGKPRDYFKVGVVTSLSGEDNQGGNLTKQGYDAWADYVNKQGGIEIAGKKYQVKLYPADDQSNPSTGADAIERLIKTEGVDFILGPYTSGVTLGVAAVTEKYKVPHVTGSAESPKVWAAKQKYTFGTIPAVNQVGPVAMEFFKKNGAQTVAIIGLDDAFSKATVEGYKAAAEAQGMNVVKYATVPANTDFTPIVSAIKTLNPDVIAIGSHEKAAIEVIKAAKSLNYHPKALFQHYGMTNASFKEGLGKDADYVFGATYWLPNTTFKDPLFGDVKTYADYYNSKYKHLPDYTEAACTAAGVAFQEALKQVGSAPPLDQAAKDKLVDALEKLNITTAFGPIQFAKDGDLYHDNVSLQPIMVQLQNGQVVSVTGSAPMAQAKYPVPDWKSR